MKHLATACVLSITLIQFMGCNEGPMIHDYSSQQSDDEYGDGKYDASAAAVFLDFEFDASLRTRSCFNPRSAVDEQLLYTVGQLNGHKSVGRLDRVEVTHVEAIEQDGNCHISYHARIPVAWGKPNETPDSFTLLFPKDVSHNGTKRFMEKYEHSCLSWGAHDVTPGIFWYYYRPDRFTCHLDADDIVRGEASVRPSQIQTQGKYPEYHKVWEDEVFEVVAIFGKVKDGGDANDGGVHGFYTFIREIKETLHGANVTTDPAIVPSTPTIDLPEISFDATFDDGRRIKVSAFLIDSVGNANGAFWSRYESLTPTADFIVYNGHSGLGANIQKLARKGVWSTGQYSIVFMNGCDTYAYVDSALADAHAAVNEDDPDGTLYLDVVANAMPSFFRSMPEATMAIVRGLMDVDNPKTYEQIFADIDPSEVVLVTGEHDNVYEPGYTPDDTF